VQTDVIPPEVRWADGARRGLRLGRILPGSQAQHAHELQGGRRQLAL